MNSTGLAGALPAAFAEEVVAESALEAAFDCCGPSLYRYFAVRTGDDAALADDFMQQLWLQAQTATTQPAAAQLEFWLRTIARNLVHAWWRKSARETRRVPRVDARLADRLADMLVSTDLPAAEMERREVCDQLRLALTELASEHQELIVEHYFQGRQHAELAARYGLSPRAIEGRLYRARTALREKLKHLEA